VLFKCTKCIIFECFVLGIEETVKLVQAAGGTCYGYVCDLCDRVDIYKKAKIIREKIGKVNIIAILILFYERLKLILLSSKINVP